MAFDDEAAANDKVDDGDDDDVDLFGSDEDVSVNYFTIIVHFSSLLVITYEYGSSWILSLVLDLPTKVKYFCWKSEQAVTSFNISCPAVL